MQERNEPRRLEIVICMLRIDKAAGHDISVFTDHLADDDIVARIVSAKNEDDIFVLGNEFIPHLVAVVEPDAVSRRADIVRVERGAVVEEERVRRDDNIVVRIAFHDAARPFESVVVGTVIKANKQIIYIANAETLVRVCGTVVAAVVLLSVRIVIEIFAEHKRSRRFGFRRSCNEVVVAAGHRIGYLVIQAEHFALDKFPLIGGVILGHISKSDHAFDLHFILVFQNEIVDEVQSVRAEFDDRLRVADAGKREIVFVGICKFVIVEIREQLVVVSALLFPGFFKIKREHQRRVSQVDPVDVRTDLLLRSVFREQVYRIDRTVTEPP